VRSRGIHWLRRGGVGHRHGVVQIDLAALPDDPDVLRQMLREVVPELQAENEKLWLLIQRLLRHRYGPRSEKLDLDQLQLVLEDAEQSAAESDAAKDAAEPSERRRPAAREGGVPATLWMPHLRGRSGAGTRTGAADRRRHGDGSADCTRGGQQVLRFAATLSPGADAQAPRHHLGPFHAECLGGTRVLVAGAAV
jgi:hypothetical protein